MVIHCSRHLAVISRHQIHRVLNQPLSYRNLLVTLHFTNDKITRVKNEFSPSIRIMAIHHSVQPTVFRIENMRYQFLTK